MAQDEGPIVPVLIPAGFDRKLLAGLKVTGAEPERIGQRLALLVTVARLWKLAVAASATCVSMACTVCAASVVSGT